jgi:2-succinyl-5-enolpyruvyl-6-hydroxy-3-cyclohexene-1-carboxylate synthase
MSQESEASRTARILVEELVASGLQDVCVSPGSRSTPLTLAFVDHAEVSVSSHIDERAGSFYALGLAKSAGRPVALVCTSGTAVANYLPAVIEASLSRVPLVILSADRPPELQDCGANQTIQQEGLFGNYVRFAATVPAATVPAGTSEDRSEAALRRLVDRTIAEACGRRPGPVHLNCQFREPFLPRAGTSLAREDHIEIPGESGPPSIPSAQTRTYPADATTKLEIPGEIAELVARSQRPLFILGPRGPEAGVIADPLHQLAQRLGAAVFAEVTANLRHETSVSGRVDAYDALLRAGQPEELPDLILRGGGVPTSKALSKFLANCAGVPQIVLAEPGEWPDPEASATHLLAGSLAGLLTALADQVPEERPRGPWAEGWVAAGSEARRRLDACLDRAPAVEGAVVRDAARILGVQDALFVGNSLAVRDLDLFCDSSVCDAPVFVNRGASGIDGLVSTVFGIAAGHAGATLGVMGDVSFLHDAGGLLAATRTASRAVLVVLDNDGGGIFDHLPLASEEHPSFEEFFITSHGRSIAEISRAWGVAASEVTANEFSESLRSVLAGGESHVLVVAIDRSESQTVHREAIKMLDKVPGWN